MQKLIMLLMVASLFTACNDGILKKKDTTDLKDTRKDKDRDRDRDKDRDYTDQDNTDRDRDDRMKEDERNSEGWSRQDRNDFINSCVTTSVQRGTMTEDAAEDYCSCMLDKIEREYPDVKKAERLLTSESSEMRQWARDCQNQ